MIDWVDCILTSLSMSVDACSVNATNGLKEQNMKLRKMLLISLSFGIFQFVMPVIGYFLGHSFEKQLETAVPWISFALLFFLGAKSFADWLKERIHEKKGEEEEIQPKKLGFVDILIQSVATSIDALCIGFVYLKYEIPSALIVFSIIGAVTFTLSFLSVFLSKIVAKPLEKWAGLIAAIVFVGVGIKILLEGIL